jgi:hypothetical protein
MKAYNSSVTRDALFYTNGPPSNTNNTYNTSSSNRSDGVVGRKRVEWCESFKGFFRKYLVSNGSAATSNTSNTPLDDFYILTTDQTIMLTHIDGEYVVCLSSTTRAQRDFLRSENVSLHTRKLVDGHDSYTTKKERCVDENLVAWSNELNELSRIDNSNFGVTISTGAAKNSSNNNSNSNRDDEDDVRIYVKGWKDVMGFYECYLNSVGFVALKRLFMSVDVLPSMYTNVAGIEGFVGKSLYVGYDNDWGKDGVEVKGIILPNTVNNIVAAIRKYHVDVKLLTLQGFVNGSSSMKVGDFYGSTNVFDEGGNVKRIDWEGGKGRVEIGGWGEGGVIRL